MRGLVSGLIARRRRNVPPAIASALEATARLELLLIRYAGAEPERVIAGSVRCHMIQPPTGCAITWHEPAGAGVHVLRRHLIGLSELQRLLERASEAEEA